MRAEDYTQGDAFQVEKRTIFSTEWLPLCAAAQVPKPGDFVSSSVGGWGVVAVRDGTGNLRVLRNACRHQNMPVVGAPSGNCTTFRCRFHGWTYDLGGRFVEAPPPMAPPPSQTDRDLAVLATKEEARLVFFSLGHPSMAPGLPDMSPDHRGSRLTEIDGNWKVVVEHLLAEGRAFHWPLLAISKVGAATIVEQVVPHTFLRTRLLTHVFGEGDMPTAESVKQSSEALQAERAAGRLAAPGDFHRRLEAAYAGSS